MKKFISRLAAAVVALTMVMSFAGCGEDKAVPAPKFSVASGEVEKGTKVAITTTVKDAAIYYTTDETTPTRESNLYTEEIEINSSVTIRAFAVKEGLEDSKVSEVIYIVQEKNDDPDDPSAPGSDPETKDITFAELGLTSVISAVSDYENVATVEITATGIKITAVEVGNCTITAKETDAKVATVNVEVNESKKLNVTIAKYTPPVQPDPVVNEGTEIDGTVTITGEAKTGKILTATYKGNAGKSVTWQWYSGDDAIEGATGQKYTLKDADIGKTIKVKVTGTGDYKGTIESAATDEVKGIEGQYLTFSSAGEFTFAFSSIGYSGIMQYSTDKTAWTNYVKDTDVKAVAGEDGKYYVYLRGLNNKTLTYILTYTTVALKDAAGTVDCDGNVMVLLDCENPDTVEMTESNTLARLFYNCTSLAKAPELPATKLQTSCYYQMFYGCTSLAKAPELPATKVLSNSYWGMFNGCTSLKEAPELPATNIYQNSYEQMFSGCTALEKGPSELPSDFAYLNCYYEMFSGCTSLKEAPVIKAETISKQACKNMFRASGITEKPVMNKVKTVSEEGCYGMFYDCKSLTEAPELTAKEVGKNGYGFMFNNCEALKTAPELPATKIGNEAYRGMFTSCKSLETAPSVLPVEKLTENCYTTMFSSCEALKTVPVIKATTLATGCYDYMFYYCSSLNIFTFENIKTAPDYKVFCTVTADDLPNAQYMFEGSMINGKKVNLKEYAGVFYYYTGNAN